MPPTKTTGIKNRIYWCRVQMQSSSSNYFICKRKWKWVFSSGKNDLRQKLASLYIEQMHINENIYY
jgi:hypothetical protein